MVMLVCAYSGMIGVINAAVIAQEAFAFWVRPVGRSVLVQITTMWRSDAQVPVVPLKRRASASARC